MSTQGLREAEEYMYLGATGSADSPQRHKMPRVGSLRYVTINSYTSDALPLRRTSPDGDWTENVYDENPRRVGQTSSDPSCEYGLALDSFGRTVAVSNSVARYAYALANCGVATNETATVGSETLALARGVDAYGRVVSLSRDGVEDAVVYNPTNGTIATISNAEACVTYAYTTDLLDAGHELSLANGSVFGRHATRGSSYYRERVTSVRNSSPVATNSWSYSYDTLNRPVARNSDAFAYNQRGEVTNAVVSAGGAQTNASAYSFDYIGNLLALSESVGGAQPTSTSYVANGVNQYLSMTSGGETTWTSYSANGELVRTRFGAPRYDYDAESRLSAVVEEVSVYPTNSVYTVDELVSSRYDHLGRRVQKTTPEATHTYFYDGWMLIKEVPQFSGPENRHAHGNREGHGRLHARADGVRPFHGRWRHSGGGDLGLFRRSEVGSAEVRHIMFLQGRPQLTAKIWYNIRVFAPGVASVVPGEKTISPAGWRLRIAVSAGRLSFFSRSVAATSPFLL